MYLAMYLTVCYAAMLPEAAVGKFFEKSDLAVLKWVFAPVTVPYEVVKFLIWMAKNDRL